MSEATFSIGGKQYTVACAEGEEAHVARLGAAVDAKLEQLGDNLAPREAQNLLFAALLIAEDLHQLKNSITADSGELDQVREELAEAKREASAAQGQHAELKQALADRESELSTLQSAIQSAAKESDDIRADLAKLRSELEDAEQVENELRSGLAGLVEERDALQEEAEELRAALANELQNAASGADSGDGSSARSAVDPELAPALERFAELLENCADKLEGRTADA